ncbi:MAG: DUF4350 domain-containing protein [Steroidobacteraceae bacterium]
MKERFITLLCALGALLLFITLFVRGGDMPAEKLSVPTSAERGPDGLLGAVTWLAREHVATRAVRERFDAALARLSARSGNLLIVTLPAATPFRTEELHALDQWLRQGNTLLVLAAIADRPGWAADRGYFTPDLNDLTELNYHSLALRSPRSAPAARSAEETAELAAEMAVAHRPLAEPQRTSLAPNRDHAYLAGVRQAVAWSDYPWRAFPGQTWTVSLPRSGFVLSLAHQRETGEGVLWVRPRGAGTIIVSGFASLFSNRALGIADNARLLGNIVAASLGEGGSVLIDDEHQGLSDAYDPARFYRDPRLYATLGILAVLWLTWVLGGTRLRIPASRTPAPREAQLVRATGAFLARVLTTRAAARLMFVHFLRRVARRIPRSEAAASPWELLEHHPRIARADFERLREWYAAAHSPGRVPLTRLHNLMIRIERQLAA